MIINLTAGAIPSLSNGEPLPDDLKPVLQVTEIKLLNTQATGTGGENKERYRFSLSDGTYSQQGVLAPQLNDMVRSQQVRKGSIVRLTEYSCHHILDKAIILIIKFDVIKDKCDIIGDPKKFAAKLPGNETSSIERSAVPMQSSLRLLGEQT
ncbi:hypothetical protein M8C21_019265 [Ambrosia artemisiifolia]|uniref:Replication factor-A protein 1 N-terminal domain-containing protein n=1 Tax=Ambrosia artemisiifolia TaxID=4212 RepID=A0AAD5G1P7_AMBAR|nr:hypothetical protein M8C21_019265 [Ambrosia artemisiifolia]